MKYIVYLRVSTDQQAESGLGLDAQRSICAKYVQENGNHPSLEFMDEGYSGALSMDKRPSLLQALDALEKGDFLVVAKRDRLGRDIIVNAMIESAIERKKAYLVSASGDFRNDGDPSSILMKRMIDAFAEYERLIIGARTKAALQIKKKNNERIGHVPFGYRLCTDGVHLEYNDKEQEILKMIAQMRAESVSFRKIANELNNLLMFNRLGPWNHVSVRRVMK